MKGLDGRTFVEMEVEDFSALGISEKSIVALMHFRNYLLELDDIKVPERLPRLLNPCVHASAAKYLCGIQKEGEQFQVTLPTYFVETSTVYYGEIFARVKRDEEIKVELLGWNEDLWQAVYLRNQ